MKEIGIARRLETKSKNRITKYQARPLIETVEFDKEYRMSERSIGKILTARIGLIITVAIAVTAGVGVWTFQQTPRYLGKFQLLVESGQDTQLAQLPLERNTQNKVEDDTPIEILRSPKVLKPIFEKISPRYRDLNYKALTQKQGTEEEPLKITRLPKTKILEISYADENPDKILFVLKNLADSYLNYGIKARESELKQGIAFVNAQLPKLEQKVAQYEENLQKLRQKHNFLEPQQHANQLSKQLVDLETLLLETQTRLKETTSLYQSLQKQSGLNPEQAITSSSLSESPRYQQLLNQLQQVEIEIAQQSTIFVEDSPIIQTLKEKRDNLQSLLKQEATKILGTNSSVQINQSTPQLDSPSSVRLALNQQLIESANQITVLQTRQSILEKQIQYLKTQIQQMPTIARQYAELQRQINIANESVSRFLDAQEKIQIEASQKLSPWQLISDPEVQKAPIYPHPTRNLGLGMLAGLLLGVVVAVVAEKLDNKFHSPKDLQERTRLPIIGYIPFQKNIHKINPSQELKLLNSNFASDLSLISLSSSSKKKHQSLDRFWVFLEAFMSMYANVHILTSNLPLKSIVISSATVKEGKSIIALYLAKVAAAMGQRVLLVETDLRDPDYYQWVDVPYEHGLAHVLTMGSDLATAIQKVPQWENLSILMAGGLPTNSAKLLASQKMQQIMTQLHEDNQYDLVIYDSPPILSFPDAKILAASTQAMLLVTQMGKTDRKVFKKCLNELKMSQIPLLGLVANGVSRRHQNIARY